MWWWLYVGVVDECGGDVRHANGGDGSGECGGGFVSVG